MSFYRIYRPQVIAEIDNVSVREQLLELLNKDRSALPHAYLFSGPRGAGKTTAARLIAKLFNCTRPLASGPCGKCDQCTSIAEGRNIDVLEIDAASNRGIDEMRQLRDAINLSPASAPYKVYIIDEVHMLTTEAFNALLKTLEEPPKHAVFVLATTDVGKVPATIRSRCISVVFGKATTEELVHALKRIVKKEDLGRVDDEALAAIAETVDGSFRDAVKLLEQVSFHKGKITKNVVRGLLSVNEEKTIETFLAHVVLRQVKEALTDIADLVRDGRDVKVFLVDCLTRLHHLLIEHVQGTVNGTWRGDDLKDMIRRFTQAYGELRTSPIASLPLELAVVEFCSVSFPRTRESSAEDTKEQKKGWISDRVGDDKNTLGLLTLDKLNEFWRDFIEAMKPYNHSVAGVLRSARPKEVKDGIVTIEAFYKFHQEKLSETKTREALSQVLKKLFGEKVKVEVVLGKK
ncbi:MAG: DNA polymerase III subunit gamma/tau [Patescibacteria group bacterium]